MLYRADYEDGTPVKSLGRDFLSRHMTTARRRATEAAQDSGQAVTVSSIGTAGVVRPRLVIRPDGGAQPPTGMTTDCTAGPGNPPCFCRNCRAARRRA